MPTLPYQNADDARRERPSLRRQVFGKSWEQAWREFAQSADGTFVPGSWLTSHRVLFSGGDETWEVTLDTTLLAGRHRHTRARARYVAVAPLSLRVRRAGALTPMARWLGRRDLMIGNPWFDHAFVTRASDAALGRRVLANGNVRDALARFTECALIIDRGERFFGSYLAPGHAEVRFEVPSVVKDAEHLRLMCALVVELLTTLAKLGVATAPSPPVLRGEGAGVRGKRLT